MERTSKQREAILALLRSTDSHPTADWIYDQVRREMRSISLGTVYRNLRVLCECGKAQEIDMTGAHARFDGNPENHYHFRCDNCGRVFDGVGAVDKELDQRVARETGFQISHHRLEFRGLCTGCQRVENLEGRA
jgi:Fur family peroxide stress response transcriptional regulator